MNDGALSGTTYEEMVARFRWQVPERFNLASAICDRHAQATPDKAALIFVEDDGRVRTYTFREWQTLANRFANALDGLGIRRGDIVGLNLPQSPEILIAHVALQKIGAVALPLFPLFGPDAIRYRLIDSGAVAMLTTPQGFEKVADVIGDIETLKHVITTPGPGTPPDKAFWPLLERGSSARTTLDTAAEDPLLLMYTSGTTGNPKGVLHAHRVIFGHIPCTRLAHLHMPQPDDRYWTPADWNWAGGYNTITPPLFLGVGIVGARREKFDPDWAVSFMGRHGIRNTLLPPTALRFMRALPVERVRKGCSLRSIISGGEAVGADTMAWCEEAFGFTISEIFGQTEGNLIVGNCPSLFPAKAGSMGRAVPGHVVEVIDHAGNVLPPNTPGMIAVKAPDPTLMLRYWNKPEATAEKYIGDWFVTGDTTIKDEDGYFWFKGRDDDIISSAGYRIGPTEVEECLCKHPAVRVAGVVGLPDPMRGEAVTAFVVLAEGHTPSSELASEIQAFVRERLAAHEYPRAVHFIDEMPMTITGKVRRLDLRKRGSS
jgi:acetyl-CoA synthetase